MARYYGFAYDPDCLAYLRTLPQKIRKQIITKIQKLAANPYPSTAKLMKGMKDCGGRVYRERSGDYRILYVVRDTIVVVLDIDHRKDVYR